MSATSDQARIETLFTRGDGAFRFARWAVPIAPAFFGFDLAQRRAFQDALETSAEAVGWPLADEDPTLGANHLAFMCETWSALLQVPGLDRLAPDLAKLVSLLQATGANQYRIFGFDRAGGVRLCVLLLRADPDLRAAPFPLLALNQAAQSLLLWSDEAFQAEIPVVAAADGGAALEPWFAALMRAAYAPDLPAASDDAAFAGALAARLHA